MKRKIFLFHFEINKYLDFKINHKISLLIKSNSKIDEDIHTSVLLFTIKSLIITPSLFIKLHDDQEINIE